AVSQALDRKVEAARLARDWERSGLRMLSVSVRLCRQQGCKSAIHGFPGAPSIEIGPPASIESSTAVLPWRDHRRCSPRSPGYPNDRNPASLALRQSAFADLQNRNPDFQRLPVDIPAAATSASSPRPSCIDRRESLLQSGQLRRRAARSV